MSKMNKFAYALDSIIARAGYVYSTIQKKDKTEFYLPFDADSSYGIRVSLDDTRYQICGYLLSDIRNSKMPYVLETLNRFNDDFSFVKFCVEGDSVYVQYDAIHCYDPEENARDIVTMLKTVLSIVFENSDTIESFAL